MQEALALLQAEKPLHERFEESFFKKVFLHLKQEGGELVEKKLGLFVAPACQIETQDPLLQKLLRDPPRENETNSIKFSDRSLAEIEKWRQGRPSPEFAFELSVWSDIAKYYFIQQMVKKVPVHLVGATIFVGHDKIVTKMKELPLLDEPLPHKTDLIWSYDQKVLTLNGKKYRGVEIAALFKKESQDLRLKGFPLFEKEAPLPVDLQFKNGHLTTKMTGEFIGSYAYIEGVGFFHKPFYPPVISDISKFIKEHPSLFTKPGFVLHADLAKAEIFFTMSDKGISFHTQEGELEGDWFYREGEGFYPRVAKGKSFLAGHFCPWQQLPLFISQYEEELSQVKGFFLSEKPFDKIGLKITSQRGKVIVKPAVKELYEWQLIERYFVVMNRGVYVLEEDIPALLRESYVVDENEAFIKNVLPELLPYALVVDPRLLPLAVDLKVDKSICYESLYGQLELVDMAKALQAGRSYYMTPHGYIDLREERFEWLLRLEGSALSALDKVRLSAYEHVDREKLWGKELPLPALPDFKATLRGYQQKGLEWLWSLYAMGLSALLCDDMGLGKTYQAIALLAAARPGRRLILTPTSVMYHWYDKVKQCLPEKKVSLFYGFDRAFDESADIIVTSYGIARIERELFKKYTFEIIVFDEVQMAKNRSSLTWLALAGLKGRFRLGLTGTPIENNLRELKSLFDLVLPGFFPSSHRFREQFILPIEVEGDRSRTELLKRLISPFILRRKKQDCLTELPSKTEDVVWCTPSEEQQLLYRDLLQQRSEIIAELHRQDGSFSYISLLGLLIQLKKICNHPALFLGKPQEFRLHSSSKWELFEDLLEEALDGGQKVVVFSHYLGMLDIIENYLKERQIGFASLRGSTTGRQQQIMRFQNDPLCRVFVASLQAGGLGIDLTAGSTVIHYDRWWNAARENQATDRVFRMGQKMPVQVFKLATMGTVEENIDRLIAKKARLLDDIIALDGHTDFKKLTHEDWLEILSFLGPGKDKPL